MTSIHSTDNSSHAPSLRSHRQPLGVWHKDTGDLLLEAPQPEILLRMRDFVDYQGEELACPHLCYEIVEYTDLRGADFSGLFLYSAVFSHCQLAGADFTGAHLRDTAFLGCRDLHEAVGLDRAEYDGPCALDLPTLRDCSAGLPDAFLTGIGYGPEELKALRALYPAASSPVRKHPKSDSPASDGLK